MKTYIILAHTIGGLTGSATYVRNKFQWLSENGWNVVVYDATGDNNSPIIIEDFFQYEKNRIKEMYYSPSFFTRYNRNNILRRITKDIPTSNLIVVESNNPILAEWGELLASKLNAKHLIFTLGEHDVIEDSAKYNFFKYKLISNELFCIDPKAIKQLFSKYEQIDNCDMYYWNACNTTAVAEYRCDLLDSLKLQNVNIGYFGRKKPYLDYFVEETIRFAIKYCKENVNVIFLGVDKLPEKNVSAFSKATNIKVTLVPSQSLIPLRFIKMCNVIVGNAACARIAFQAGAKVISMNVETNKPLGILGFTTNEISFESKTYKDGRELSAILEDLLYDNPEKYKTPSMPITTTENGFEYQEQYAYQEKCKYYDTTRVGKISTVNDFLKAILLNIGFVGYLSNKRYNCRK